MRVANWLATSGQEWAEIVGQYNSGEQGSAGNSMANSSKEALKLLSVHWLLGYRENSYYFVPGVIIKNC